MTHHKPLKDHTPAPKPIPYYTLNIGNVRKAAELIAKLTKKGMYEVDEDFPDDPEEYYYFVGQGTMVRRDDKIKEKMSLKIKDNPDKELGDALLESGPLAAGALPSVGGASEAGSKAVLEALHGEVTKAKAPKKTEKSKEETEEMEAKEAWEHPDSPKFSPY